jgi:hypothetical protein
VTRYESVRFPAADSQGGGCLILGSSSPRNLVPCKVQHTPRCFFFAGEESFRLPNLRNHCARERFGKLPCPVGAVRALSNEIAGSHLRVRVAGLLVCRRRRPTCDIRRRFCFDRSYWACHERPRHGRRCALPASSRMHALNMCRRSRSGRVVRQYCHTIAAHSEIYRCYAGQHQRQWLGGRICRGSIWYRCARRRVEAHGHKLQRYRSRGAPRPFELMGCGHR